MRKIILVCSAYLLINLLVWGGISVYANSYNAMHKEPLPKLALNIDGNRADFSVLHYSASLDFTPLVNGINEAAEWVLDVGRR